MWLGKVAYLFRRVISSISVWIGWVAAAVLAVMMFLTFTDVSMRYVFSRPILGSYDITECMMAIVIGFGIVYCAVLKGHISIELVVSRFPQRTQAIIDSITCLIGLGLFSIITWQCALLAGEHFESGLGTYVLVIPVFPFVGVVALGSAIFTLVLLTHLVEFLSKAVRQ